MAKSTAIKTLFLDIGGVLLTNGWDKQTRQRAIDRFKLDADEVNERHQMTFGTYEEGKMSLNEYLSQTFIYKKQPFSLDDFKAFMFEQSKPFPEMCDLIRELKAHYRLKTFAVSNEGRELNDYRVQRFGLREIIDAFIVSGLVHLRKPDPEIYHLALDISQTAPEHVLYIEDRQLFVEIARGLGINAVKHDTYISTRRLLEEQGLEATKSEIRAI